MKKTRLAGGLVGIVALLFSFNTFADEHEAEAAAISDVWVFALKRGMEDEFSSAMKEHMAARKEMGEPRTWYAYRAEVGHHPGLIMYRSAPMSYADHDEYLGADLSALGEAFGENIDPLVDHFHHFIDSYDWKNSHWPEDASTEGPLFTEVVRKWRPGGGAIVFPNANYADMAPTGEEFGAWFSEQLGSEEEAGAVFDAWLSGFSAVDVTIWRHDPSLSTPSDDED